MKRSIKAMGAIVALTLTLAFPAGARAETRWVCTVDGTPVIFVSAADAALHGIDTANRHAGEVFEKLFDEEDCHVENP